MEDMDVDGEEGMSEFDSDDDEKGDCFEGGQKGKSGVGQNGNGYNSRDKRGIANNEQKGNSGQKGISSNMRDKASSNKNGEKGNGFSGQKKGYSSKSRDKASNINDGEKGKSSNSRDKASNTNDGEKGKSSNSRDKASNTNDEEKGKSSNNRDKASNTNNGEKGKSSNSKDKASNTDIGEKGNSSNRRDKASGTNIGEKGDDPENKQKRKEVYLPHKPLKHDEELVCDPTAYVMLREIQTGAPCLSFDIIKDELGTNRTEFPLTCFFVAGTQAPKPKENCIIVMKTSNLHKTQKEEGDAEEEQSEDDEDEEEESEEKRPRMDYASIPHYGSVNRIRCIVACETVLAGCWSETGKVHIWNLKPQIKAVNDMKLLAKYRQDNIAERSKPLFTFSGHLAEGYAIDWCPTREGMLATGDTRRNIHLWNPGEGTWRVDQRPLIGHTDSVEDLQWSPNERNVLASASVDRTIRIWDTRATGCKACMITVQQAHQSDVNVIHWNRNEPAIVSGGDDGCIHIWDLRQLKCSRPIATFKHHTAPVTTVEWHPTEATVFASGGEDNQIALWDLGVEKDDEAVEEEIENVPPQLLFIHQGQQEIKELHWHPNIPGLLISTALSGFNIFKTISV